MLSETIDRNASAPEREKALIKQVLSGESSAFGAIIDQYQNLVGHVVFRMVSHENDREELCQEIFFKVYKNLASFQFNSKLSTWIARIAYNSCLNYLKKKKVPLVEDLCFEQNDYSAGREDALSQFSESAYGGELLPDSRAEKRELARQLQDEIDDLPPLYKTLVTLFHVDELSLKEIREVTALPDGTIKSYLYRARKILKQKLLEKYSAEEIWV